MRVVICIFVAADVSLQEGEIPGDGIYLYKTSNNMYIMKNLPKDIQFIFMKRRVFSHRPTFAHQF